MTALSCAERFVGFLYRVYLSRTIGAEGLALYQIALSVVGVIITLTASGIPITVSRLMLKERALSNPKGEQEVVAAGVVTSVAISLPITLAAYFFRDRIGFFFADERCVGIFLTMLPGITITGVYAVIRGYFWGNRQYLRYSTIELIEEIVMVVAGVILVQGAADGFSGAKSAGTAVFISYIASFVLSVTVFTLGSGRLKNPFKKMKPLIKSSSPITAVRTLTSLSSMLVALIVPLRLVYYGADTTAALTEYGKLSGMALPLLFIPSTVIGSIALVLVPEISACYYGGEKEKLRGHVSASVNACTLISTMIIPVFTVCGKDIGLFIYGDGGAGEYLSLSAFIMLPMSVSMIAGSLLNSLGKERRTLLNYLIGAAALIAVIWFAPEFIGVYALIAAYFLSFSLTAVTDLFALESAAGHGLKYKKTLIISLLSAVVSIGFGYQLNGIAAALPLIIRLIAVSLATTLFNVAALFVFGVIKPSEILSLLPFKKVFCRGKKQA